MDPTSQDAWMTRVESVEFDCCVYSPPCGTWSRANWANDDGPQPCRNRPHPWGIPHQRKNQKERADNGNRFVHFAIRASRPPLGPSSQDGTSSHCLSTLRISAARTGGSQPAFGNCHSCAQPSATRSSGRSQGTSANTPESIVPSQFGFSPTCRGWRFSATWDGPRSTQPITAKGRFREAVGTSMRGR